MTNNFDNEFSQTYSDSNHTDLEEKFVITYGELKELDTLRHELHKIIDHNPQLEQIGKTITSKLWSITHKTREAIDK